MKLINGLSKRADFTQTNHKLDNILIQGIRFVWRITVQQNIDLFFVIKEKCSVSSISALHPHISPKPCLNLCSLRWLNCNFSFFFSYNHLFENMSRFSIPNFSLKVVQFIYVIGEKGFSKDFTLEGLKFI